MRGIKPTRKCLLLLIFPGVGEGTTGTGVVEVNLHGKMLSFTILTVLFRIIYTVNTRRRKLICKTR